MKITHDRYFPGERQMLSKEKSVDSHIQLTKAIQDESRKLQECYIWLERHMPASFFKELGKEEIMLVAHNLMGFHLQEFFSRIHLKNAAVLLALNSSDADVKILKLYGMYGIKNYRAFVSTKPFPIEGVNKHLRVAVIHFTEFQENSGKEEIAKESLENLYSIMKERNPMLSKEEFDKLIKSMNSRFLRSMPMDRLVLALDMFFRAKTRDQCQYEVRYNEDWKERNLHSMQIVFAWRNTPKYNFIYRLAKLVHRHNLVMKKVNATYIEPYHTKGVLLMSLGLHGNDGRAVWNVADISDFLRELVTMKYFNDFDLIDKVLVSSGILSGNEGNLLRTMLHFIHQSLVHVNMNLYTIENVEESLCRHPELSSKLCQIFSNKFHPEKRNASLYQKNRQKFIKLMEKLDTGQKENDIRRKNVLKQGMNFIEYTLKTNYYCNNKSSLSFRLDPKYLDDIPFQRKEKFPELPYAIFFIKGMHFFGFHIRFKELSRGGLRTIFPEKTEHMAAERNNIFTECYLLAYTQQKKNKDIPEGGAKAIIFLKPYERLHAEAKILHKELCYAGFNESEAKENVDNFLKEQKTEYLYQTQRCFINSLLSLINCESNGKLKAKNIVDYWKKPEYLYLGPDENMHNNVIEWIANLSLTSQYAPGTSFITSKPQTGINHKEWGVTSLGVNVYMQETLKYLDINPFKDPFTVKISGGPDGDVAGNQIRNLHRFYSKTAKLVALTDISGTIYDPKGLDLEEMLNLFHEGKPIRHYPPKKLSEGSFLMDRSTKRDVTAFVQQTLCWRIENNKIIKKWLSGNEMNQLFRSNIHSVKADVFIPAGGRPRTLNEQNYKEFLDETGRPTAKAIVEGANLYLTPKARNLLEKLGTLIIKDSSANKGGVIASSFEVLYGLVLSKREILENKKDIVLQILNILKKCAFNEARLILETHKKTGERLSSISERISEKINEYAYLLLNHLEKMKLPEHPNSPLIRCFQDYFPKILRDKYQKELLNNIPEHHKKAIISCHVASQLVYKKGLNWSPTIIDILPLVLQDKDLLTND